MNRRLPGSTLVETLVMMLVAGIVFLAVTDALTLFSRIQARRAAELTAGGRRADGFYRFAALVTGADSILSSEPGRLELYRAGQVSVLSLGDSAAVFRVGSFSDTLLSGVATLRLDACAPQPDTVELRFGKGFRARFAVRAPQRLYRAALAETERDYGYEE